MGACSPPVLPGKMVIEKLVQCLHRGDATKAGLSSWYAYTYIIAIFSAQTSGDGQEIGSWGLGVTAQVSLAGCRATMRQRKGGDAKSRRHTTSDKAPFGAA